MGWIQQVREGRVWRACDIYAWKCHGDVWGEACKSAMSWACVGTTWPTWSFGWRLRVWRETALEIEFQDILYLSELLNVIWEVLDDCRPVSSSGAACLVTWTSDTLSV